MLIPCHIINWYSFQVETVKKKNQYRKSLSQGKLTLLKVENICHRGFKSKSSLHHNSWHECILQYHFKFHLWSFNHLQLSQVQYITGLFITNTIYGLLFINNHFMTIQLYQIFQAGLGNRIHQHLLVRVTNIIHSSPPITKQKKKKKKKSRDLPLL